MLSEMNVVCLIRGGASGRLVQEYSIRLAKEEGAHLVYLHVVDVDSLGLENQLIKEAARAEMSWLAWVTLGLAYRRARNEGVEVKRVVRFGKLLDTTILYLIENPAQQLLMGSPHPDVENYEDRMSKVRLFARQLEDKTGAVVRIVS